MGWYRHAFGELYRLVYAHRDVDEADADVSRLRHLLGETLYAGRVLDLGCGFGRHTAALLSRGVDAYGLDLSDTLIRQASDHHELQGRMVVGDMRHIPFEDRTFSTVVSLFTSFGYFDDGENATVLREIHRVLEPGGVLLLDYLNPLSVEDSLGDSVTRRNGCIIRQHRWIEGKRLRKQVEVLFPDGQKKGFVEDVRLYTPEEMRREIEQAGFALEGTYGGLGGESFGKESKRMVIVAGRKPCR